MSKSRKSKRKRNNKKKDNWLSSVLRLDSGYTQEKEYKPWFWGGIIFIGLLMVAFSTQAGIGGDEDVQVVYAERTIDFYSTYGADTAIFNSKKGPAIRYYGGGFEFPSKLINMAMGFSPEDRGYHVTRRILTGILGTLSVLFCGLLVVFISNWRMGLIALILLAFSPRFFGHAMINVKDIPFAFGYIASIYYSFRVIHNYARSESINWRLIIGLGLAMGYTLSIRSGGILVFFFHFMFLFGYGILRYLQSQNFDASKLLYYSIGPAGIGIVFGILLWPFGLIDPIGHIIESLTTFSNFPISVRVLFGGGMVMSNLIPLSYLFTWIGITIPVAAMLGLLLGMLFLPKIWQRVSPFFLLCSLFTFVFPLFYVLYKDSPLYDGWRHFNFVYVAAIPFMSLGLGHGWKWLGQRINRRWVPALIFALLMLEPAIHIVRNYAYPYVYFNPIYGGMSQAFGNYELDYWGVSTRQAIEAMEEMGILHEGMDTTKLVTNFAYGSRHWHGKNYEDRLIHRFSRYRERYYDDWDYAIYISRFMDGSHMKAIDWPGSVRVIRTIDVNNVPIAAIYEKGEPYAFEGLKAMQKGDMERAITLLEQEVSYDPKNEIAYTALGQIYTQRKEWAKALSYFTKAVTLDPENQQLVVNYAMALANRGQVAKAEQVLLDLLTINDQSYIAYYYLALFSFNQNKLSLAARYIEDCISVRPTFKQAYNLGTNIYQKIGDQARAQQFQRIANQLP